jgi:hypothetical protein
MIGHRCYVGQPDDDEAAPGRVRAHIHTYRLGSRSTWKAVARAEGWTIKSHESLVRRVGGLTLCVRYRALQVRCRVLGQGVAPTI